MCHYVSYHLQFVMNHSRHQQPSHKCNHVCMYVHARIFERIPIVCKQSTNELAALNMEMLSLYVTVVIYALAMWHISCPPFLDAKFYKANTRVVVSNEIKQLWQLHRNFKQLIWFPYFCCCYVFSIGVPMLDVVIYSDIGKYWQLILLMSISAFI